MEIEDAYSDLFDRLEGSRETFEKWRADFARCADRLSDDLASLFNRHRNVGFLEGPELSAREFRNAFRIPKVFERQLLDMFTGPAQGDMRLYQPQGSGELREEQQAVYSVWDSVSVKDGRLLQRITASKQRFIEPGSSEIPWLTAERKIDLQVNICSRDTGILSWSIFSQPPGGQLRSIGYRLGDRVLWINQFMTDDMIPVAENRFLVTVEWRDEVDGRTRFLIYGMHLSIDFAACQVTFTGPIIKIVNSVIAGEEGRSSLERRSAMGREGTRELAGQGPEGKVMIPSAVLPDINAETYPFGLVQQLLDQVAYINMLSRPDRGAPETAIRASGSEVIGVAVREVLHRFEIALDPPAANDGLRAHNIVGEAIGTFHHSWIIAPDDFRALPGRQPPPTPLDPSSSQRFVMLDGICRFGDGNDGFRGFVTGRTFPMTIGGRPELWAAAIGNITEGFGSLEGHEGTYTYCGTLDLDRGFSGNLLCRILDPKGELRAERSLPSLRREGEVEPGITYLLFRGQKRNKDQKTRYRFGSNGQMEGFDVEQQLRTLDLDFSSQERGLRIAKSVGPVIGSMTSSVRLNILQPGAPGTGVTPIPFGAYNEYFFHDRDGRSVGSFAADGSEGRTFYMSLSGVPGQQALRFSGFGPIEKGTGPFAGVPGLMTDNSAAGVAPHALSTLYVVRLSDPEGRFLVGRSR